MRSLVTIAIAALALQSPQSVAPTTASPDRRGGNPLDFMEVVWDYNDALGEWIPTIRITGANVQIVNGADLTMGGTPSGGPNGRGNLILGYNEIPDGGGGTGITYTRTGCHSLVLGPYNDYDGFCDVVHGMSSEAPPGALYPWDGFGRAIIGGHSNRAIGTSAVVVGGYKNKAEGIQSTVTGGKENVAQGWGSSVGGGLGRSTAGDYDWAAGSLLEDQ